MKMDANHKGDAMSEPARLITLQFLAWVADRPRCYTDVMDAWRSTCPQLSVWEDAVIAGLVQVENGNGRAVTLTRKGHAILEADGALRADRQAPFSPGASGGPRMLSR